MARTTTPEIFIAAVRFWAFGAIVRSKAVSRSASLGVDAPRNSRIGSDEMVTATTEPFPGSSSLSSQGVKGEGPGR